MHTAMADTRLSRQTLASQHVLRHPKLTLRTAANAVRISNRVRISFQQKPQTHILVGLIGTSGLRLADHTTIAARPDAVEDGSRHLRGNNLP